MNIALVINKNKRLNNFILEKVVYGTGIIEAAEVGDFSFNIFKFSNFIKIAFFSYKSLLRIMVYE